MIVNFTVKLKTKGENDTVIPTFKKELGQGVVEIRTLEFVGATEKDLKSPMFQKQIFETAEDLLHEWFEVKVDLINKKTKKKKKR